MSKERNRKWGAKCRRGRRIAERGEQNVELEGGEKKEGEQNVEGEREWRGSKM